MTQTSNSFGARTTLRVGDETYEIFSLEKAEKNGLSGASRLPFTLKILLENLLRFEDGRTVTAEDVKSLTDWLESRGAADRRGGGRPCGHARRHEGSGR